MLECTGMIGETPVERQAWLYRELYGLPCRVVAGRIMLSAGDISAIRAPEAVAALIDDELFRSWTVMPILSDGVGSSIILAAPTALATHHRVTELLRRAHCELLEAGTPFALPTGLSPAEARWFRYPLNETLHPLDRLLRALRLIPAARPTTLRSTP